MTPGSEDLTTVTLLFGIVMILSFALLGRIGARKLGLPTVFGELLAAAVTGKWVCGLGVRGRVNRLAIGIGMIPRGEVGLAFAFIGKSLGVIDAAMFTVLVLMVVLTTLATPPVLRKAMAGDAPASQ